MDSQDYIAHLRSLIATKEAEACAQTARADAASLGRKRHAETVGVSKKGILSFMGSKGRINLHAEDVATVIQAVAEGKVSALIRSVSPAIAVRTNGEDDIGTDASIEKAKQVASYLEMFADSRKP